MKTKIAIISFLLICAGTALGYEESRDLTLPAAGISLLDIDCGAGFLKVRGVEGLDNIEVEAEIEITRMSDRKAQDFVKKKLDLTLKKRGSRAYLVSQFKSYVSVLSIGSKLINLTVRIPKEMELVIDDGSGETEIDNITGDIELDDGSGEIIIQDVTGNLEIDDSSGELTIENIRGHVRIDDSSGDLILEDIQGEITIDDGSGSIRVRDCLGDVTISDGSGSIRINNIEKDVIIKRAGSGGVSINNVKGRVIRQD